jgi:kynurenine formamidase
VGQIPPERLVAPFVVIDLREKVRAKPDCRLEVEDIADWEQKYGPIPPNAIVAVETGWDNRQTLLQANSSPGANGGKTWPGFSEEAVKFLVQARETLALGSDAPSIAIQADNPAIDNFTLSHSVYHLENLTGLDSVPATGSIVMVAPAKLARATAAPVRVLAMVR